MKTRKTPLTYENPLTAVFMRTLAWEIHEAERNDHKPLVKELVDRLGFGRFQPVGGRCGRVGSGSIRILPQVPLFITQIGRIQRFLHPAILRSPLGQRLSKPSKMIFQTRSKL